MTDLVEELREKVARIIDPHEFEIWQSMYDYCVRRGDTDAEARVSADYFHITKMEVALAKADAILALLTAARSHPREGEDARLREALQEIANSHLPDQPAASDMDERTWAMRHIGMLRSIAIQAIALLPPAEAGELSSNCSAVQLGSTSMRPVAEGEPSRGGGG